MPIPNTESEALYLQIGCKVAYYRKLRKKTPKKLAEETNISLSGIRKIEKGEYNNSVSVSILYIIAKALNIELYKLFVFDKDIEL